MGADRQRERRLYRKRWQEIDDPLVREARAQTLALQRLQTWLRLAYAALALTALMAYAGLDKGANVPLGVAGCVLAALSLVVVVVLRTGISHGRANVGLMLDELESRLHGA